MTLFGFGEAHLVLFGAQRRGRCASSLLSVMHPCPILTNQPPQGQRGPIGAEVAVVSQQGAVNWGHLGADVVQYGGGGKRYDMVEAEPSPGRAAQAAPGGAQDRQMQPPPSTLAPMYAEGGGIAGTGLRVGILWGGGVAEGLGGACLGGGG